MNFIADNEIIKNFTKMQQDVIDVITCDGGITPENLSIAINALFFLYLKSAAQVFDSPERVRELTIGLLENGLTALFPEEEEDV